MGYLPGYMIFLLVSFIFLFLPVGCQAPVEEGQRKPVSGPRAPAPAVPEISPVPIEEKVDLLLFFPHAADARLVGERREAVRRDQGPEEAALAELLKGPRSLEARPLWTIPVEGAVAFGSDLKVMDGVANVYLSGEALESLVASDDPLPLYAVVETLGRFQRVRAVQFLFDGQVSDVRIGDVYLDRAIEPGGTK